MIARTLNQPAAGKAEIPRRFSIAHHRLGLPDPGCSPINAMRIFTRAFGLIGGLVLSCWSIHAGSTNALLTFHIVSEQKVDGWRFC
jgi:hypothetical protein